MKMPFKQTGVSREAEEQPGEDTPVLYPVRRRSCGAFLNLTLTSLSADDIVIVLDKTNKYNTRLTYYLFSCPETVQEGMPMSEDMLVEYCSPTLAGLKTGNLFSCRYSDRGALEGDIRRFNQVLKPRGLCLLPLKIEPGRALMYLYRPSRLERDLSAEEAAKLLDEAGYSGSGVQANRREHPQRRYLEESLIPT